MNYLIDTISVLQDNLVTEWHMDTSKNLIVYPDNKLLLEHVVKNHRMNYDLWHIEDVARMKDVEPKIIMDCKYKIDILNQHRNDYIEKIDNEFIRILSDKIPSVVSEIHNTETLGMAIDRLSILALKVYHMREQTLRKDVNKAHMDNSGVKLAILQKQRQQLSEAIKFLISEYLSGKKQLATYYQFKMYNDPTRNPKLYDAGR